MTSRAILSVFENYQAARSTFVQTVAELAVRPQNIEALQNVNVMSLLRPLLLDTVPSIQQSAALALGRLANSSEQLAEAVVSNEVLPQLVYSLAEQNRFYKKAAAFVLRAVARHSPELAQAVVDANALDALVGCLEEFEPSVKEAAAWALGYIAKHNEYLAQAVVDAQAVARLVLCVQEPELSLKRIAASALSEIAKHTPELAHAVVDCGAVAYLAPLIVNSDAKLKRQVCSALAHIAKHSPDLAEVVVEAEIFPKILILLKDHDSIVRKNAATCIREIARQTPELSGLVVQSGGHSAMIEYITQARGNNRLPGIMTLGFMAAFSEALALAIIVHTGIIPLMDALEHEPEDHIKSSAAWALCHIGRHTPDHAKALAVSGVLKKLIQLYQDNNSSDDLKEKCQKGLKNVLQKCTHLPALEPLLQDAPEKIMKYLVSQFAKILRNNTEGRKSFLQSGCLEKIQHINAEEGSQLKEDINTINSCYPPDIVKYYRPDYAETLLKKLDEFEESKA